jgi:drug/metabolite transporter (DMT)-like permease
VSVLAVLLSLLAAMLFAVAAAAQQQAARTASTARDARHDEPSGHINRWLPVLGLVRLLARDRIWLVGWVTNLLGFLTQAAALHFGSLAVVQPLLVTPLLFALPLTTLRVGRGPLKGDWAGGALICAGLAVLLSVRGAAPQAGDARRSHVLLAAACAMLLVAVLLVLGRSVHDRPQERAMLVAVGAGICFAMSAVFITLTTDDLLNRGVAATATDWPGYALAVSTLVGLLLGQDAFAAGSLPTAVAAMTITNPVVSYLAGVFAFDVRPPTTSGALAGVAAAGALIAGGVVVLARSPTVHEGRLAARTVG